METVKSKQKSSTRRKVPQRNKRYGRLNLCPNRIGSAVDCGDALIDEPAKLWNGPIFTMSRGLFNKNGVIPGKNDLPCIGCLEFAQPWKKKMARQSLGKEPNGSQREHS